MRPSFYPKLVNDPADDPGVFIPFLFEKRALLFDLGEIHSLSAGDILKISHVFVSHTHIDHFSGFERLLRLLLGREKELYLYGPRGFLKNVEGKLAGYSWNLVGNYSNRFMLQASEVREDRVISRQYLCQKRFVPEENTITRDFDGILLAEPALSLSAAILDHHIPCLGFSLKERFHVNIISKGLGELGLGSGPWLKEFKEALFNHRDPESLFTVRSGNETREFILKDLAEQIALISPGQKVTYITDVKYNESNAEKILALAKDSDYLFIEAAFLEKDKDLAAEKCHLTAWQAGSLAARASAKQFTIFHFSPRYTGMENLLQEEAEKAYNSFSRE